MRKRTRKGMEANNTPTYATLDEILPAENPTRGLLEAIEQIEALLAKIDECASRAANRQPSLTWLSPRHGIAKELHAARAGSYSMDERVEYFARGRAALDSVSTRIEQIQERIAQSEERMRLVPGEVLAAYGDSD